MALREPQPIDPNEVLHSPSYFFWDGKLHKLLKRKRAIDAIYAQRMTDNKMVMLSLSAYNNAGSSKYAYTSPAVSKILNRGIGVIKETIQEENLFELPPKILYLSAEQIIAVAEVFIERAYAHPKNKYVNQTRSVSEVKSILNQEQMYFVKTNNGFIPAYREVR